MGPKAYVKCRIPFERETQRFNAVGILIWVKELNHPVWRVETVRAP